MHKVVRFYVMGRTEQSLLLSRSQFLSGVDRTREYCGDFLLCQSAVEKINELYRNHRDKSLRDPVKVSCNKKTGEGFAAIAEPVYWEMLQQRHCLVPMEAEYETVCSEMSLPTLSESEE